MKTFYIIGPESRGEGLYSLVADDGEFMASHFCSHAGYADSDLWRNREERQKVWKERFGEYQVLWIGDDGLTKDELIRRNKEWFEKTEDAEKKVKENGASIKIEMTE